MHDKNHEIEIHYKTRLNNKSLVLSWVLGQFPRNSWLNNKFIFYHSFHLQIKVRWIKLNLFQEHASNSVEKYLILVSLNL